MNELRKLAIAAGAVLIPIIILLYFAVLLAENTCAQTGAC